MGVIIARYHLKLSVQNVYRESALDMQNVSTSQSGGLDEIRPRAQGPVHPAPWAVI